MNARAWTFLIAASGHLMLAVLGMLRGRASPIARPLALVCVAMFGWCFASAAYAITNVTAWSLLDSVCTALTPPLALHFVVTFVGGGRTHARAVAAAYVVFGALAISSATALVTSWGRTWVESSAWGAAFLAAWVPLLAMILVLLVRHLVTTSDHDEKARTRLVLAALAIGGAVAPWDVVGADLPKLAPLGTLAATSLGATAAFRFRLFDRDLSRSAAVYAIALAIAGVIAYVGLFRLLGGNAAAVVVGTASVTLVLAAAVREVATSMATHRERVERLAALGRFSNQMAHDLKNPLATIKGALQFLQEERARGESLDGHHEFLDVMLEQVERLHRVVDDYQRIGRVQAVRRTLDVNALVRGVVLLEEHAIAGVTLRAELADDLPACELDAELVSGALHNLIRNALEAMPNGGALTVRTERADGFAQGGIVVSVEDAGEGMDARHAERAFDDFYTTKANGSGLGLAFARRVAQAHGGDASLSSRVGAGTIVRLRMSAS
jgi:signal transduction histidine kinase